MQSQGIPSMRERVRMSATQYNDGGEYAANGQHASIAGIIVIVHLSLRIADGPVEYCMVRGGRVIVVRILVAILGVALVLVTFRSVIRTFVLPRSANDSLTRLVFLCVRVALLPATRPGRPFIARDGAQAMYAPVALLALLVFWLTLVLTGYTAIFWALAPDGWITAFKGSGSALFTLGFSSLNSLPETVVAFSEATVGLILIALLIAYLPTIYSAFSKRESAVTMLEVRAGDPPSTIEMILRYHRLGRMEKMGDLWPQWEVWFSELEETHTSLAALAFFRSPKPTHSWITAAGAVLDAAALTVSTLEMPPNPEAHMTLRAGYLALRSVADLFQVPYNADPKPGDAISIARAEFDEAYETMEAAGVPLKPDRDQAWRDFAGWRVNYDIPLVGIARLIVAPPAPWSSDRSVLLPTRKMRFTARLFGANRLPLVLDSESRERPA